MLLLHKKEKEAMTEVQKIKTGALFCNETLIVKVGARNSPLSQAQMREVLFHLALNGKKVAFDPVLIETTGDKDKKTSLRHLGKSDFFTKELDELLLSGGIRAAIHSAKDLPEHLLKGLKVVAITYGVDSRDVLVLREGETLRSLPKNAVIATSSERREEAVKALRPGFPFRFVDLRGSIGERLARLNKGHNCDRDSELSNDMNEVIDGVVVAEAALIRLNLIDLNRIFLPGETASGQGQLAIVIREDDVLMEHLFECLDALPDGQVCMSDF